MTTTLSEADSKALLGARGIRFADEYQAADPAGAVAAARSVGYPVAVKLCGDLISHKTERGLVRLGLGDEAAVHEASVALLAAARLEDGDVSLLVAPMITGARELIAGLSADPQFGMTVMIGLGGILAEAVADVAIRVVPITEADADEMLDDLVAQSLLGPFRGEPAVDRAAVVNILLALSSVAETVEGLVSVDLNPLIISNGMPIAVDALVEMAG